MTGHLQDQTALIIGRRSALARAVALAARDAGVARVVAARGDKDALDADCRHHNGDRRPY